MEDFTTYTEVDPGSDLTVTATKIDAVDMARGADTYVADDKGANHFDGDFEHLFEFYMDSADKSSISPSVWAMANLADSAQDLFDGGNDSYKIAVFTPAIPNISLYEIDFPTLYFDTSVNLAYDTLYYVTVKRDESIGSFGQLQCFIYDDAGRTSLVDTLALTLHTDLKDFRWVYGTQNEGTGSGEFTGFVQNLNLQEGISIFRRRMEGYK